MAGNQIDLDSLNALYVAITRFGEAIDTNSAVLESAADAFDQAMGSDAIAQKKLTKMNGSLEILQRAARLAELAADQALRKTKGADDIITEA